MSERNAWPDLRLPAASETLQTMQLWLQIVGKIRLAQSPWWNHSWHVPFYVTTNGLDSGLIPNGDAAFSMTFDLRAHELTLRPSDGDGLSLALQDMTVAEFHGHVVGMLKATGIDASFHGRPSEMPDDTPFVEDHRPRRYDPAYAEALWRALLSTTVVFQRFRTGFLGKVSPVHFFWGAMDLAVTRFSGRPAPQHPGGIPNLPDAVTREAYSHEVSSAGFWPGDAQNAALFYSYAYPEPDGFAGGAARPNTASYHATLREFVLPYDDVRTADDPAATLMEFLQSTYALAAELGAWPRAELECELGEARKPRQV